MSAGQSRHRRAAHFTAFHPDYKMRDVPPTPPATLARGRRIARDAGLRFVYTGNVHDDGEGGTTYRASAATGSGSVWWSRPA